MYQCVESLAYVCNYACCLPDPACSQGKNWKVYAFWFELMKWVYVRVIVVFKTCILEPPVKIVAGQAAIVT